MHPYAVQLESYFRTYANTEAAVPMAAYMRERFPFLGIRTPDRNRLLREFMKANPLPKGEELVHAAGGVWSLPEREFQYIAMVLYEKHRKHAEQSHIDILEGLITDKSWWDTVDLIASRLIGFHLAKYPELMASYTERWIASDNFWLQRTALLYQLSYKKNTDEERLFRYIRSVAKEKEFFIRKAIGWALREYSKTNEDAVRRFVAETELSPLSQKEALKYVERKNA